MDQEEFVKTDSNNLLASNIFTLHEFIRRDDHFNADEVRGTKMKKFITVELISYCILSSFS